MKTNDLLKVQYARIYRNERAPALWSKAFRPLYELLRGDCVLLRHNVWDGRGISSDILRG
jgi:hypothetical protein